MRIVQNSIATHLPRCPPPARLSGVRPGRTPTLRPRRQSAGGVQRIGTSGALSLISPNAKTLGFNDHQVPPYVRLVQRRNPAKKQAGFLRGHRMPTELGHNNAAMAARREAQEIREPLVARYQDIVVSDGVLKNNIVYRGAKTQLTHVVRGTSSRPQRGCQGARQITVDQEPHHVAVTKTSSLAMPRRRIAGPLGHPPRPRRIRRQAAQRCCRPPVRPR